MSDTIDIYKNIKLSKETIERRNQIKTLQDEFMTFSWRGFDAFHSFGAFIINDKKGSLKFYNGPSFSNEYTKPQFDANAGELMGVNFNRNTISFTIGVYWISEEHYRYFLNWLDPLVTDYITFGFNSHWRYNVKLSKIGDSTKWIVGREDGKPMYYTELGLSFEVQGVQCAKGMNCYEWENKVTTEEKELFSICTLNTSDDFIESDLPTPLEITSIFDIWGVEGDKDQDITYAIKLQAKVKEEKVDLYNVSLKNLTHTPVPKTSSDETSTTSGDENSTSEGETSTSNETEGPLQTLHLKFNSETGLLYLQFGNSTEELLTLLTTNDSGQRIVSTFTSNKFFLPGEFDYPSFYNNTVTLELTVTKFGGGNLPYEFYNSGSIVCYPRTNII